MPASRYEQLSAPWATPELWPCCPLCPRVFPRTLIALHRSVCSAFALYAQGVALGQFGRHRPWCDDAR